MATKDEYLRNLREENIFTSDVITFRIGPGCDEFLIHRNLVTRSSSVLKAGLRRPWIESCKDEYELQDVDTQTFRCFVDFLYTGTYEEPVVLGTDDHESAYSHTEVEAGMETPNDSSGDQAYITHNSTGPVSPRASTPDISCEFPYSVDQFIISLFNFKVLSDPTLKHKLSIMRNTGRALAAFKRLWPNDNYLTDSTWSPETDSHMDVYYRPNLLCNAKVYVFAERYIVEPLKQTSLYYIKQLLCHFIPRKEHVAALIDVVHEIYEGTLENDPARILISSYFGCFFEHLKEPEITELYQSYNDFYCDVLSFLQLRLKGDWEN